ncbi:MAG: CAP domain-containing protein, partial [Oscillospiraceae bacterium]|nr:CAP domain-containing protein [Oscillospiraceae bacterium]
TTTVTTTTTPELTTTVTTTTTPGASAQIQEIEIDAVNKINQARTSAGYRTLKMDTTLCYCADIRVKELQQSYSVNRPDGSQYNTLLMNNDAPGWYQSYQYANKNFTSADSFVAQLVRFFAKNPGQGINDPAFNNIGVGYDNGYWVVFFTV